MKFDNSVETILDKRFKKFIKKFEKKLNSASKYLPTSCRLTPTWWRKHGDSLSNIIDELWDNHQEEFQAYMKKKGWETSKPSIADLMC